jgi:Family of unknown function (DUF6461)
VNGHHGSRSEVLRQAAAGGQALSVYWNVNAHGAVRYAAGGRTSPGFDVLRPEDSYGPDAAEVDSHLADLPFGHEEDTDWQAVGLALAERITGVRLPEDFPTWSMPGVLLEEFLKTSCRKAPKATRRYRTRSSSRPSPCRH